jgi:hypothetical protein
METGMLTRFALIGSLAISLCSCSGVPLPCERCRDNDTEIEIVTRGAYVTSLVYTGPACQEATLVNLTYQVTQVPGLDRGVQTISGGDDHTCAITNSGAWCWGSNSCSQLGDNTTFSSSYPVQVQLP